MKKTFGLCLLLFPLGLALFAQRYSGGRSNDDYSAGAFAGDFGGGFGSEKITKDYYSGRMKLTLNTGNGRFLLSYLADIARDEYRPLFSHQDLRTSFLSVFIDSRTYRMGESGAFRTRIGGTSTTPALVFESETVVVTEEFNFIRTANSGLVNGVKIVLSVENRGEKRIQAGLKFTLDTSLGENEKAHFTAASRKIPDEILEDAESEDTWWLSDNGRYGLMGSLPRTPVPGGPAAVHFANWKRLNDSSWKTDVSPGRNFNQLPYSINDSGVSYYFDPAYVNVGEKHVVSLLLSAKDTAGFAGFVSGEHGSISRLFEETTNPDDFSREALQEDLITLHDAVAIIDRHLNSGESLGKDELDALQLVVARVKTKYGYR